MCTNTWYFDSLLCSLSCHLLTNWGTFDLFFDVIIPALIIFISNFALFRRVVYQNMIIIGRVRNNWQRERKMAFQLGIISFVYLAVWIPLSIAELGQIYINPTFLLEQLDTFNFLVYIVPLILPMVCLMSMSEIIQKFKTLIFRKQNVVVMPLNETHIRHNNINHPSKIIVIAKF
jgi:phosphatidylglycerophosphate synthase